MHVCPAFHVSFLKHCWLWGVRKVPQVKCRQRRICKHLIPVLVFVAFILLILNTGSRLLLWSSLPNRAGFGFEAIRRLPQDCLSSFVCSLSCYICVVASLFCLCGGVARPG